MFLTISAPVMAQFNLKKAISGATKVAQAATLTDEQMAAYVKEYIDWVDTHNPVCDADSPYTQRLNRLVEGLSDADGIPRRQHPRLLVADGHHERRRAAGRHRP